MNRETTRFDRYKQVLSRAQTTLHMGKVDKIVGLVVEATGISGKIGDICLLGPPRAEKKIRAEVVGFRDERVLLVPLEDINGVGSGSMVEKTNDMLRIPVGDELIGRTLDGYGQPIDALESLEGLATYSVGNIPSNPLTRPRIDTRIHFGIKAIDGLLTCGQGQRMGIFSGSGVGKSTLMGMIARNIDTDVNVIALVGERGREVRDFIEKDLGEGMERSVLVVATSDQPAMMRLKCAMVATTIAEYFRDQGKNVLLMMDSLTRFAMAQREIGLAVGEPPVARGYTPSIYTLLPKLLERSGKFDKGSITGIYTVLVEGDDLNEPISDTVRGIIDGHIVLSRSIAMRNHYPAIDIQASVSRLMYELIGGEHRQAAAKMRGLLALYEENLDLISIGAYKAGANPELDKAIAVIGRINGFLQQGVQESFDYEQMCGLMDEALTGENA